MFLSHLLICILGIISSKESPHPSSPFCGLLTQAEQKIKTSESRLWKRHFHMGHQKDFQVPYFTPHPKSKPTDDNSGRNNQNTLSHLHGADEADASPREKCSMLPLNLVGSTRSAV